ncbi:hypothetical protein PHG01_01014 [Streptococcus mutans PKUSS-HG01]|nr:hypothetical protein SMUFR_0932 [Streptococcus mutans UA159-FR]ESS17359.1 hypothetical protein PHG01_01014 [Streptococcus mutans PKUSS-HG01]ESS18069.1 hypothetical protein PLG01_00976 [Streptococcus mutans PKUSS-LG01]
MIFDAGFQLWHHQYHISILFLIEMITCAYIVTYVQVYLFNDFDEAKRFSLKEWVELLACIILYDLLAYLLGWFGRGNVAWVLIFFSVYLLICYFSIYIANKIKRKIDTNRLNQLLEDYKKKK